MSLFSVPSKVSFGTTLDRDLLPLKPPHTRAGNELGLRGQPNLAPGAYDNHEVGIKHFHATLKSCIVVGASCDGLKMVCVHSQ